MRLIILGAGGYGRTVADVAAQTGSFDEIAFLDDNSKSEDVLSSCGDFARFNDGDTSFYPAFGNNGNRVGWLDHLVEKGCNLPTIIHPSAYVSPTAEIMSGVVILPQAVVNTNCQVKHGCIINCSAIVDHDCVLEEGVHVCLGAIVKGGNRIPRCMKIEAGGVIKNKTYPL